MTCSLDGSCETMLPFSHKTPSGHSFLEGVHGQRAHHLPPSDDSIPLSSSGVCSAPFASPVPNPTDEPNRCSLRQQTPKRPRKPLYLGFFACGRPPQIVCLAWLDFPMPGPPSRQQKPEQNRWHPPRYWSPFTSVERRVRRGFPRSRVESRRFVQNRAHFFPCRTSNSGSGQRKGTI
jgi:hypothetical protein